MVESDHDCQQYRLLLSLWQVFLFHYFMLVGLLRLVNLVQPVGHVHHLREALLLLVVDLIKLEDLWRELILVLEQQEANL